MTKYNPYQDLSGTVEKELALILGKITHHIHPDVINRIIQENVKFKSRFEDFCHKNLDTSPFFYSGSDCVFPGIRRPINREKPEKWKNRIYESDGTIFNDNTYPRHIWAYLTMNKFYSGGVDGLWTTSGLNKFELAHVFGHKQDERNIEKEVFQDFNESIQPYGLFTSASNTVLIPKGFAKPTDHMRNIKVCFYKRHIDLYGNNIIGLNSLKESSIPDWYDEIQWLEPKLVDDWEEKISTLLKYRENHLHYKYNPQKSTPIRASTTKVSPSSNANNNERCLPITLDPPDAKIFKLELLKSKLAVIETTYIDGRVEQKPWKVEKLSTSSNIMGNLRSRKGYRSGNWQDRGIAKVHVKIKNNRTK